MLYLPHRFRLCILVLKERRDTERRNEKCHNERPESPSHKPVFPLFPFTHSEFFEKEQSSGQTARNEKPNKENCVNDIVSGLPSGVDTAAPELEKLHRIGRQDCHWSDSFQWTREHCERKLWMSVNEIELCQTQNRSQ
jgi:hypothetical protein